LDTFSCVRVISAVIISSMKRLVVKSAAATVILAVVLGIGAYALSNKTETIQGTTNSSDPIKTQYEALDAPGDYGPEALTKEMFTVVKGTVVSTSTTERQTLSTHIGRAGGEEALSRGDGSIEIIMYGKEADAADKLKEELRISQEPYPKWLRRYNVRAESLDQALEFKAQLEKDNTKPAIDMVIKVSEYLKNPQDKNEIIATQPIYLGDDGDPQLDIGQEVILFLVHPVVNQDAYRIFGGGYGKYVITGNQARSANGKYQDSVNGLVGSIRAGAREENAQEP
jgi:hypothetical protein